MIYLFNLRKKSDVDFLVTAVHEKPFDPDLGFNKTADELSSNGILVDSLPQNDPGKLLGKYEEIHVNPITKEVWYEYVDIPKTPEQIQAEKLEQLENQTAEYFIDIDFRLSNIELGL